MTTRGGPIDHKVGLMDCHAGENVNWLVPLKPSLHLDIDFCLEPNLAVMLDGGAVLMLLGLHCISPYALDLMVDWSMNEGAQLENML